MDTVVIVAAIVGSVIGGLVGALVHDMLVTRAVVRSAREQVSEPQYHGETAAPQFVDFGEIKTHISGKQFGPAICVDRRAKP